jgi:hypothetical protein
VQIGENVDHSDQKTIHFAITLNILEFWISCRSIIPHEERIFGVKSERVSCQMWLFRCFESIEARASSIPLMHISPSILSYITSFWDVLVVGISTCGGRSYPRFYELEQVFFFKPSSPPWCIVFRPGCHFVDIQSGNVCFFLSPRNCARSSAFNRFCLALPGGFGDSVIL